jgi:hypothetical protein
MPATFRVSERHPDSRRTAIVVDEGDSVWLYLTEASGEGVTADCWLMNRIPAPRYADLAEQEGAERYRGEGLPPPAIAEVVTEGAFRATPLEAARWRFTWAANGESVAAFYETELVGFIARGEPRGFSRFLRVASPWGEPLDLERYLAVFG